MGILQKLFGGGSGAPVRAAAKDSHASAYLRAGQIVLRGTCQTDIGGLMCGPSVPLAGDVSDAVLGTELLRVLQEARSTPALTNLKEESQKLFQTFGVRSWSKLHEGAVNCSVKQTPQHISFLPTRNENRTFFHLPERQIEISAQSSPAEIGKALRDRFKFCT